MKIEINKVKYLIKFNHTQEGDKEESPLIRHTECKILVDNGGEVPAFSGIGYSRCHPKDNFCKETGRQLSLKKALEDAEFSKEDRKTVWENYRTWGDKTRF